MCFGGQALGVTGAGLLDLWLCTSIRYSVLVGSWMSTGALRLWLQLHSIFMAFPLRDKKFPLHGSVKWVMYFSQELALKPLKSHLFLKYPYGLKLVCSSSVLSCVLPAIPFWNLKKKSCYGNIFVSLRFCKSFGFCLTKPKIGPYLAWQ